MSDRLALAMDGSTRVCSVALLKGVKGSSAGSWEIVGRREEADGQGQARVLLRLVDEALAETGAGPEDLGVVVVGVGPGTFTGVRIAVATARGLALALSIPVWGVSTLAALAAGAAASAAAGKGMPWSRLVPVVDARRRQVFYGLYERVVATANSSGAQWTRLADFAVCDREALGSVLGRQVEGRTLVIGDARSLVGDLPGGFEFHESPVEAARLIVGQELLGARAGLAEEPTLDAAFLDTGAPERDGEGAPEWVRPLYVRSPDADVHIGKMKDPWAVDADTRR